MHELRTILNWNEDDSTIKGVEKGGGVHLTPFQLPIIFALSSFLYQILGFVNIGLIFIRIEFPRI